MNMGGIGLRGYDVCVDRGELSVISGLSFAVDSGTALLLTGPNGAGKTTLIRAIAGLLPISGGSIATDSAGGHGDQQADTIGELCHYVGFQNAVKPHLTVRENQTFWAGFLGGGTERVDEALDAMGLAGLAHIPARYLSSGQQRRVAIARLLVAARPIWLLDEPTVSLDKATVARLVACGNDHLARGGIIIAATHLPLGFSPVGTLELNPASVETGLA